jgi:tetratricopeptide (TPR) repeat protein
MPTPQQKQQAQALAQSAATQLEMGNEAQALADLQRALSLDANHKTATTLKRQISDDPLAMLGRESFIYVVRPNDSLSTIAGRFLGDVYLFYALARYNNIAVPRQLAAGQSIKVPGKAPPAPAVALPPAPAPAPQIVAVVTAPATVPVGPPALPLSPGELALRAGEAAEQAQELERALVEYRKAAQLDQPAAQPRAGRVQRVLVDRYSLAAHKAFLGQDLEGAIRGWSQVLRVDPGNERAQLELQRCKDLRERVAQLPK